MPLISNTMLKLSVKGIGYKTLWENADSSNYHDTINSYLPVPTDEEDISGPSLAFSSFRLSNRDYFISTVSKWNNRKDDGERPGIYLWNGGLVSLPHEDDATGNILAKCLLRQLLVNERNYVDIGIFVERAARTGKEETLKAIFRKLGGSDIQPDRIFTDLKWVDKFDLSAIQQISIIARSKIEDISTHKYNIITRFPVHNYLAFCCLLDLQSRNDSMISVAGGHIREFKLYNSISSNSFVQGFTQVDLTECFAIASGGLARIAR